MEALRPLPRKTMRATSSTRYAGFLAAMACFGGRQRWWWWAFCTFRPFRCLTPLFRWFSCLFLPLPTLQLKLVDPTADRLQHLVTQLQFRLGEGQGEAIYEIGVTDSGVPQGLTEEEMEASLGT